MKRIFFMAVCMMAAWSLSAQMTVWSNGQSVYSHPVENVDSISFNAPASAQVMTQQASTAATSFEGKVYLWARVDKTNVAATNYIAPAGFAFYSSTEGYYFFNHSNIPGSTGQQYTPKLRAFTYTVSGQDITVSADGGYVANGKIVGTNAIVIYETTEHTVLGKGVYFLLD